MTLPASRTAIPSRFKLFTSDEAFNDFVTAFPGDFERLLTYAHGQEAHALLIMPDLAPDEGLPTGTCLMMSQRLYPFAIGMDPGCGYGMWILHGARERLTPGYADRWVHSETWVPAPDEPHWAIQALMGTPLGHTALTPFLSTQPGPVDIPPDVQALPVHQRLWECVATRAAKELGKLAPGNHFVELHALQPAQQGAVKASDLLLVVHNGGLSISRMIQMFALRTAAKRDKITEEALPLLSIFADSLAGQAYQVWLEWAYRFAVINRAVIAQRAVKALQRLVGTVEVSPISDLVHSHIKKIRGDDGLFFAHLSGAQCIADNVAAFIGGKVAGDGYLVTSGRRIQDSFGVIGHGSGPSPVITAQAVQAGAVTNLASNELIALHRSFRDVHPAVAYLKNAELVCVQARTTPVAIVKRSNSANET